MLEGSPKFRIGSIDFAATRFAQVTQEIFRIISSRQTRGTALHFANAHNIALAEHDRPKQDGERVYGPDVTQRILHNSNPGITFHYFLGSTPETMDKLQNEIKPRFPLAQAVGCKCPPFREPSESELAARDRRITDSGATVVCVGLGTPKQDYQVERIARALPVTAIAVGTAFDFIAQTLPREAKRLVKRYFWGNPQFIRSVLKNRP